MKVREVHQPWVVATDADASLVRAASVMRRNNVGWAVVFDGDRLAGIITERDILRASVEGADLRSAPVAGFMTKDPETVDVDQDVRGAAEQMLSIRARHLPVVEGGTVVGMLSARDLLHAVAGGVEGEPRRRRPGPLDRLRRRPRRPSGTELVQG